MALYWILAAAVVALFAMLEALGVVALQPDLPRTAWVVAALVLLNGGWMAFDGARALVVGDYFTPRSGPHAGALGPWARFPEALGLSARSTVVKTAFVLYGGIYLVAAFGLLVGLSPAPTALLVIAMLGLWYVPFGMAINLLVIALLLLPPISALGG